MNFLSQLKKLEKVILLQCILFIDIKMAKNMLLKHFQNKEHIVNKKGKNR